MSVLKPICEDILKHLGVCLVSEAGHGKSFLAFQLVKQLQSMEITVYIFSPSNIWLKRFGKIEYLTVGNKEYNPIVRSNDKLSIYRGYSENTVKIDLDKKWQYLSNGWLETRLLSMKTTLFNIRYLNGRRIKYFIVQALKHLYLSQRDQKNPKPIVVVLEEAQNPFGTYSMNDDISLEMQTAFTQSRSDANIHYIVIGQRLNDMSTKIVERLRPVIGLTLGENALRKIKSQLPKELRKIPQSLKAQNWLYPKTTEDSYLFKSPRHEAKGKPIKLTIPKPIHTATAMPKIQITQAKQPRRPKKKENLLLRIWKAITLQTYFENLNGYQINNTDTQYDEEDEEEESDGILFIDDEDP